MKALQAKLKHLQNELSEREEGREEKELKGNREEIVVHPLARNLRFMSLRDGLCKYAERG